MKYSLLAGNQRLWGSPYRRLLCLKWTLCAAMLSALAFCPDVWRTVRPYPTVPVLDWIPDLPPAIAAVLTALLVCSVIAVAALPSPKHLTLAPPILAAILVLFDINRLQPCIYQYSLMFVGLSFLRWDDPKSKDGDSALGICAFIVIAIYFWSGIQKMNATFAHEVFPFITHPLGPGAVKALAPFWFIAPVTETSIGLLLFFPRTRMMGIVGSFLMHGVLLGLLGPFGQNYDSIVWPWNFWTAVMVFTMLFRNNQSILSVAWKPIVGKVVVVLVGLLPVLNYADRWDGFLSFSYYSGRLRDAWIYLTPAGISRLPAKYVTDNKALQPDEDRYRMDITKWSYSRLNLPPYAEVRVYVGLMKQLVAEGVPADQMILLVRDKNSLTSSAQTYSEVPFR